ncbi:MAG: macro domain-containing protein [Chloroflexota bacterium]|nr:macro domain-containing protein [Chloroflexota bacterium]
MLRAQIKDTILELVKGDITKQETDAIVNAANTTLMGGGGVDGAIHNAAGGGLKAETRKIGRCDPGDAKITGGYNLKAKHIIHTVGPIYKPNSIDNERVLASAFRRSLELAAENRLKTIAFPAISTGIYGYPREQAAPISFRAIVEFAAQPEPNSVELVRFVLYDDEAYADFVTSLRAMAATDPRIVLEAE